MVTIETELTSDRSLRDPFGRIRVSEPYTLFDSKHLHDKQPLVYNEDITDTSGNAASTHVAADACVTMYVEADDTIIRQSFVYLPYQPGKGQYALLTGVLGEQAAGVTSRIGLFDDNEGLFFNYAGGVLSVVIRKGTVDVPVNQVDWNLDQMDGTGPSGIRIDEAKAQIFVIDFEWLGVGTVRFGFVVDGAFHYCHLWHHANSVVAPYTASPNLPVRFEISSTSGTATMKHICASVMSEGGVHSTAPTRSYASGKVDANDVAVTYAILGIKLRTDYPYAAVDILDISVLGASADNYLWQLVSNPTVAGSFTYNNLTNSCVAVATGATANEVTGGTVIASGYAAAGAGVVAAPHTTERLGRQIDGTATTLVLCTKPITTNADIYGTMTWQEYQ